jgi:hypothetical protein
MRVTGRQLSVLWAERDERYKTNRRQRLTKYEETIVREFRGKELSLAREPGVAAARAYLTDWSMS